MINYLTVKVASVCPIDGISASEKDDKKTWRIDFRPEATDKQRADAQAIMDAFDWPVEEALLEKVEKHKRVAMLKAARMEAVAAGDTEAAGVLQKEINAAQLLS